MVGTVLGHYRIIRALGKGGMGEVYLAEDSKLDRQVAIKVLPASLRSDESRLERFRREARAAAKLKHPNIATIHALEEIDDTLLIVMEYVEGKTLAEHIPKGGMELDDFFSVFIPLADALSHAHQNGRIHRDLKPGNIMLDADGTPKILDFGLARIIEPDSVQAYSDTGEEDETRTMQEGVPSLTIGGQLIGTPQYMSPEQAERKETDARTDIFSFGLVMYEALSGQRAFDGDSVESIIGRILEAEPKAVTELRPITPYTLWTTVRKCITKKPSRRMQSAEELYADLEAVQQEVLSGTVFVDAASLMEVQPADAAETHSGATAILRQPAALVLAAIALIVGIGASWFLKPATEMPVRKFRWPVEGLTNRFNTSIAISPNGAMVAYIAEKKLWVRDLDETSPREISGTEGAMTLFWSPTGDELAYVVDLNELRTVAAGGGPSFTIFKNVVGAGAGTWKPDGMIISPIVGPTDNYLGAVSSLGGVPVVYRDMGSLAEAQWFDAPHVLPDGQTLIFAVEGLDRSSSIVVEESDSLRVLVRANTGEIFGPPVYSSSGHILYHQGSDRRDIWAVPFDVSSLKTIGKPFKVAEQAQYPSVSTDGTLAYSSHAGGTRGQLTWVDRSGKVTARFGQPQQDMIHPALSPDERRVAVQTREKGNDDVWVHDTERGTQTPLTFDVAFDGFPDWSPDGRELIFTSSRRGNPDIFRMPSDGSGGPQPVVTRPGQDYAPAWAPGGQAFIYASSENGIGDIWMGASNGEKDPVPLVESDQITTMPSFSPDGRFIAYKTVESGRAEVYVTRFPEGDGKWLIGNGTDPKWSGNGKELFYESAGRLMAVSVTTGEVFRAGTAKILFTAEQVNTATLESYYDVTADGQRFLVIQQADPKETPSITVVQNWYEEFKDRN